MKCLQNNSLLLIITLASFIFPVSLYSQVDDVQYRPKIGLVLSGGGAKGIAHIGIIKAMEREGIKPDFISGTSMGSIIGGLYATGYSADQLDTIVRAIDWSLVLSNNIPLNYISYEEKEYYNRYLAEFPIIDAKLTLPTGLIEGQMLSEVLTHYTWPSMKYESFDDFPIPFRCVATDVSTGNPIIFNDGPLSEALRASMSIPTAFTAAKLDSTLAVDGGVVNNFPVEELINMGADIIIGVNVGDGFIKADEIGSMTGILVQVAMIPGLKRLKDQIELCDIYIKPDLKNYGTASFSNYKEILELGYAAGEKHQDEFRKLAQLLKLPKREFQGMPLKVDSILISTINLEGNKLVENNLIRSKLGIFEGNFVSRNDIEKGVRRVYGLTNFKKVIYHINKNDHSETYTLTIKLDEKPPGELKASVHYDNLFSAGILLNLTLRNMFLKSSRTIFTGDVSKNPKFRFDYLVYTGGKRRAALNINYEYLKEEIPSYESGLIDDIQVQKRNIFSAGFISTQSLKQSIYIGSAWNILNEKSRFSTIIPSGVKNVNSQYLNLIFSYFRNTLDDRNYSTKGLDFSFTGSFSPHTAYRINFENGVDTVYLDIGGGLSIPFSEEDLNRLIINPLTPNTFASALIKFNKYIAVSDKFQFITNLSTGLTFSTDSIASFQNFRVGGNQLVRFSDNRFMGLNFAEIDVPNFAIAGLFMQNVLFRNLYLKYGANLLLHYEHISLSDPSTFDPQILFEDNSVIGFGIQGTYKSPLGPISGGISRNTRDSFYRYYLAIGFSFNYKD